MMLPWVALGLILAVGLLISVLYTSIMFFVNHEAINGILWLVIGLVTVGEWSKLLLLLNSPENEHSNASRLFRLPLNIELTSI